MAVTDAQIEAALLRNYGNVTAASADLGITSRALRFRVNGEDREKFAACRFEATERLKDLAEHGAAHHVLNMDGPMIRFTLSRLGQDRGWAKKTELSGPNGGAIPIAAQPVVDVDGMPDDERELLRELLERQRARQLGG